MKKAGAIALAAAVAVIVMCMFRKEKNSDADMSYYSRKLGTDGQTGRQEMIEVLGPPLFEGGDTVDYGAFALRFDRTDTLTGISVYAAEVDVLKGVHVGDERSVFTSSYEQWLLDDRTAIIFYGEYSLTNSKGVQIACKADSSDRITEIQIDQIQYK